MASLEVPPTDMAYNICFVNTNGARSLKLAFSTRADDDLVNLPIERAEFLRVAEILTEIDMKQMSGPLHHDVLVVTIANAQDVRGDAVACARVYQVVDGHSKIALGGVVLAQPVVQGRLTERAFDRSLELLDLEQCFALSDHFDETAALLRLHHVEQTQAKIEIVRLPDLVHARQQLENALILLGEQQSNGMAMPLSQDLRADHRRFCTVLGTSPSTDSSS